MATFIAIGYPDEVTASAAAERARECGAERIVARDALAVLRRDREGGFRLTTTHQAGADSPGWGMYWSFVFGWLLFVPVLGMEVGSGLGAVLGEVEKARLDDRFRDQVRDMLQPGTSALFLVVDDKRDAATLLDLLGDYGGTVLTSPLSKKAEAGLRRTVRGAAAGV